MQRIYIEAILAFFILFWSIGNGVIYKEDSITKAFYPLIIAGIIQMIFTLIVAVNS